MAILLFATAYPLLLPDKTDMYFRDRRDKSGNNRFITVFSEVRNFGGKDFRVRLPQSFIYVQCIYTYIHM